mgnify:CR=1 FL=1
MTQTVPLSVVGGGAISLEMEQVRTIYRDERPAYDGPYSVTPSAEEQVLDTNGKRMTGNVTVGAIPSNYGLVTWNGSVLTVS